MTATEPGRPVLPLLNMRFYIHPAFTTVEICNNYF